MVPSRIISSFSRLGQCFEEISGSFNNLLANGKIEDALEAFRVNTRQSELHNLWFTPFNVKYCLNAWAESLKGEKIGHWLSQYNITETPAKNVGVVMAGNIPFVGLHDLLCVLASGHRVMVKTSSHDAGLISGVINLLFSIEPNYRKFIEISSGILKGFDAIIATGSNNTSRYFEYYFGKYPNLIRKNRNGICVITGDESPDELRALGDDIFLYFGLGCRNVSKLFVPNGYEFKDLLKALGPYNYIADHNKYRNNYDYQKSIMIVNQIPIEDNGFLLLRRSNSFISPVAVVNFEFYKNLSELNEFLTASSDQIQCIVSHAPELEGAIPFGKSQRPELWDYADNIDTMSFLLNL